MQTRCETLRVLSRRGLHTVDELDELLDFWCTNGRDGLVYKVPFLDVCSLALRFVPPGLSAGVISVLPPSQRLSDARY